MSSGGVKDFYRQKKKGGVTKAASSSKKKTQQYTGGASVGAPGTAQTSALVSHGSWDLKDDFGDQEEQLRQFDMDMKFGPCIGVTRLQRWERASAMGLQLISVTSYCMRHQQRIAATVVPLLSAFGRVKSRRNIFYDNDSHLPHSN